MSYRLTEEEVVLSFQSSLKDSFERQDRSSSSEEEEAENSAFHEAKKIRRKRKNPKRKVF